MNSVIIAAQISEMWFNLINFLDKILKGGWAREYRYLQKESNIEYFNRELEYYLYQLTDLD